jgi:hypothetical protein
MQMSREGLAQTLLYELLQQELRRDDSSTILESVFPDRWEQFDAFGGGKEASAWSEPSRALERLTNDTSKRFFLVINGLDEFDGDPSEMCTFLLNMSRKNNIEVCVAGQSWPIFENDFHRRPSLPVERLTEGNIREYVETKFKLDRSYDRLLRHNGERARALTQDISRNRPRASFFECTLW